MVTENIRAWEAYKTWRMNSLCDCLTTNDPQIVRRGVGQECYRDWEESCDFVLLPEVVESIFKDEASKAENIFCAWDGPEHAGLLCTLADDGLAAGLNNARANEVAVTSIGAIKHAKGVGLEVADLGEGGFGIDDRAVLQ